MSIQFIKTYSDTYKVKIILLALLSFFLNFYNANTTQATDLSIKNQNITLSNASELANQTKFLYLNGEFLEASILSSRMLRNIPKFPDKDTVVLIKWLSDLKLNYKPKKEPYIKTTTLEALPGMVELFKVLYEQGNFNMVSVLSKKLKKNESLYFRAVALYGANRASDSIKLIKKIPNDSKLYPFGQVFYGQILAISEDKNRAIKTLKDIESRVEEDTDLYDRLHLLLGQLLFDKKNFREAEGHFLNVSITSPQYKIAVKGQIKSKVLNGLCEEALEIISKETTENVFFDDLHLSMLIEKSKCELSLGDVSKSAESIIDVIANIKEVEQELNALRIASPESDKIVTDIANKLLRATSALDTTKAVQFTSHVLEKDKEIIEAISQYNSISTMTNAFISLEGQIKESIKEVYSKIDPELEKMLSIRVRLAHIWELQQKLGDKVFDYKDGKPVLKKLDRETRDRLVNIHDSWERSLNRKLTKGEKRVIHVFALQGPSGLEYLENTLYSDLLLWFQESIENNATVQSLPERIIADLHSIEEGKWVDYNSMFPKIERKLGAEIEEDAKILSKLTKLLTKTKEHRTDATNKTNRFFEKIKKLIRKRIAMTALELKVHTNNVSMVVRDINLAQAELQK